MLPNTGDTPPPDDEDVAEEEEDEVSTLASGGRKGYVSLSESEGSPEPSTRSPSRKKAGKGKASVKASASAKKGAKKGRLRANVGGKNAQALEAMRRNVTREESSNSGSDEEEEGEEDAASEVMAGSAIADDVTEALPSAEPPAVKPEPDAPAPTSADMKPSISSSVKREEPSASPSPATPGVAALLAAQQYDEQQQREQEQLHHEQLPPLPSPAPATSLPTLQPAMSLPPMSSPSPAHTLPPLPNAATPASFTELQALDPAPSIPAVPFKRGRGRPPKNGICAQRPRKPKPKPQTEGAAAQQLNFADPTVKPPYSYASMIAQAITDSGERKATTEEIWHWIQNKYAYYTTDAQPGWQVRLVVVVIVVTFWTHAPADVCEAESGAGQGLHQGGAEGRPRTLGTVLLDRPTAPGCV